MNEFRMRMSGTGLVNLLCVRLSVQHMIDFSEAWFETGQVTEGRIGLPEEDHKLVNSQFQEVHMIPRDVVVLM